MMTWKAMFEFSNNLEYCARTFQRRRAACLAPCSPFHWLSYTTRGIVNICVNMQAHTTHTLIHTPHKQLPLTAPGFQGCVHCRHGQRSGEQAGEEACAVPKCTLSAMWAANSVVLGFHSVIQKVRGGEVINGQPEQGPEQRPLLAGYKGSLFYTSTYMCMDQISQTNGHLAYQIWKIILSKCESMI